METIVFHINDSKTPTRLEVTKGDEVIIRKSFKSLKVCLRWIYNNSKSIHTKEMVEELISMREFISGGQFKFKKV